MFFLTVSEEKACTSKHLHSCTLSEHQLATAAAVASTSKVPPLLEMPSENAMKSNYESDKNFDRSFFRDNWTFYPNVSEVRWNQRPTHTYDSCFMLPDTISDTLRVSEGKLKVVMDNEFDCQHGTSLRVEILSSEIKSLINEKENVLRAAECISSKSLKNRKKSNKAPKKAKKVLAKRVTAGVNSVENLSPAVSLKDVPPAPKKKKVLKPQPRQKWSGPEMLGVLEEDIEVQEPGQDSTTKLRLSSKAKKGVKKHKKIKKDEEKYFKEVRRKGREASFNQSLAAYISVCVSGLGLMFYKKMLQQLHA